MPPKKKVIKEKKQKKVKQKQSQSQKVIINLNEVKTKPKGTRKKATNKNIKFYEISENDMGAGWSKYGAPDEREINTLKGKLNDVENKLLSIKNVENPVNNDRARMLKIEEGMKNMFVNGNNAISDIYSKLDNIGDFSNKTKFQNPVKEEQKKQSQPIYIQSQKKVDTKSYSQSYYQRVTKPKNEAKKLKKKEQTIKEVDNSNTDNKQEPFDLEKYINNNKKIKQEADEKYDYMSKYIDEVKNATEETTFI